MQVTVDYSAGSGDCWGSSTGEFDNTGVEIVLVENAGVDTRSWIPFTVALKTGTVIVSATLKLIASVTSGVSSDTVTFGCEAADNPANPSSKADLFTRTLSSATYSNSIGQYVLNTTYSYDVTNAVQEIINRAGWSSGNTLAMLMKWTGSGGHLKKYVSNEGGANKAVLEVVADVFVPNLFGIT